MRIFSCSIPCYSKNVLTLVFGIAGQFVVFALSRAA